MALSTNFYKSTSSNDLFSTSQNAVSRSRVGGSTFTAFTWQGNPITFARQIRHQSPAPVGPGTTPIHPLDVPYPVELVTPQALTMGTLMLELYELYGANVWDRLNGLGRQGKDGNNIVDLGGIFQAVANSQPIHIYRVIIPPAIRGKTMKPYTLELHNCVVSALDDGETIEIGTMEILKQITVNYTHVTRGGQNNLLSNKVASQGLTGQVPPGVSF